MKYEVLMVVCEEESCRGKEFINVYKLNITEVMYLIISYQV